MKKFKMAGLLATLTAAAMAFTGCGAASTAAPAPASSAPAPASSAPASSAAPSAAASSKPAALKKIVIAEPVHLTGYLPLYVAMHEGYFADEGLDVEVIQATGGAHVTAVVSGDAWGVIGGVDSNALANKNSSDPITSIVNVVNRANVYLFAKTGLAPASGSDADLAAFIKGKTIVAGRHGGSPNLLTRYLLIKLGLDPDKDVTLVENADAAVVNTMLQQGQGEIGNGAEPQVTSGIVSGIWNEPFYKFPDLGDFSYSVVSVKKSTIDKDPETCQKFVNAMVRALKTVQSDKATAEKILRLEFPTLTDAGVKAAQDRAYADLLWSPDGLISQAAVDTDMDVLIKSKIYEGAYDYNTLVDMQFVKAAK